MFRLDADQVLRSSLFDGLDWLEHGFGTRLSEDWPGATATLKQIHSADVTDVREICAGELGAGDGLISGVEGVRLSIRTADCVPLLFADPVRRVVAAVHAGWRGTAAGIAAKAIEKMVQDHGCIAADILAAIGPAIGVCCYEVSADVAAQVLKSPEAAVSGEKVHLDLEAENRRQLLEAGLLESNIDCAGRCTRCDASEGLFESFRRDGERSGRMHARIGIQGRPAAA